MTTPTPAERLKALRTGAGLSQQVMAAFVGCGYHTWQSWELQTRTPPEWQVRLIEYYVTHELGDKK